MIGKQALNAVPLGQAGRVSACLFSIRNRKTLSYFVLRRSTVFCSRSLGISS